MGEAAQAPKPVAADPTVCPKSTRELVGLVLAVCERMNGVEFYTYQKLLGFRIIESLLLRDGDVITALFARQSGKSECLSCVALGCCVILPWLATQFPGDQRLSSFKDGLKIGIFAPKLELSAPIYFKIRDRTHADLGQAVLNEAGVEVVQSRGDSLALSNGSIVRANTASEQTINEGATYHLVLIDEAQRVAQYKVNKEISPMLAATNGTMAMIGTAWMSRGGFHNNIQNNINVEKAGGPKNHFQFDYEQVLRERRALYNRQEREFKEGKRKLPADEFHLNWERWLTKELQRMGGNKDSEEFKMNFRLLWQESRSIAIKEAHFLELCVPESTLNTPKHYGYQVAGLDVAKSDDSTVLTVLEVDKSAPIIVTKSAQELLSRHNSHEQVVYHRKQLLGLCELQGSFETVQYNAIVKFLMNYSVQIMYVDSTGIGDPVCERLQVLLAPLGIQVEPYRFSLQSKSDLFKLYMQEIEAGRFQYPSSEATVEMPEFQHFYDQHISLEKEWNGGYLVCEAPEGEHDDYPCSGALACWAAKQVKHVMPVVEQQDGSAFSHRNSGRSAMGSGDEKSRASRYLRGRRH